VLVGSRLTLCRGAGAFLPPAAIVIPRPKPESFRGTPAFPNGFEPTYRPHKLRYPHKHKEPALIFANSMSEFFDEQVPDEWRDRVLKVMRDTPHLQYRDPDQTP
jgi:hypothetical protein